MGVFKEEILSSWRWVLIFGTAIGLLSIVNVYLFAGVNPSFTLILISATMILSLVFACCAVYFHRNKNLNGHITMTVGFTVAFSTIVWGIIVGLFVQNYLLYGSLLPPFSIFSYYDAPRVYYSSDIDMDKIDREALQQQYYYQLIKSFAIVCFVISIVSWLIARVFKKGSPQ